MASWNVGPVAGAAGVLDAVEASVDVAASVEMARFTRTMRREAFQRPVQRPGVARWEPIAAHERTRDVAASELFAAPGARAARVAAPGAAIP